MYENLSVEEIRERYMIQLKHFDKKLGRDVFSDYLKAPGRVLLFRKAHELGSIQTEIISLDEEGALIKATVLTENDRILATGFARAIYAKSAMFDGRAVEKAETAAVARALLWAGFGTDAAGDDLDETSESDTERPHYADSGRRQSEDPEPPASEPPASDQHWYDTNKGLEFADSLKRLNLTETEALKLLDLENWYSFPIRKDAAEAVLEAVKARDEAKDQKPATAKAAAKSAKASANWWENELEMKYINKLLAVFELDEEEALKALEIPGWSSYDTRPGAEAALRKLATENEWTMIATGCTYQQKGDGSGVITLAAPIILSYHAGRDKFANMAIDHNSEKDAEWRKIKTWKAGQHEFPEPIRVIWGVKSGKPYISYIEPASLPKIG